MQTTWPAAAQIEDEHGNTRWQPQRANGERLYWRNPTGQAFSYFWKLPLDQSARFGHPQAYRSRRRAVMFGGAPYPTLVLSAILFVALGVGVVVIASGFIFGW